MTNHTGRLYALALALVVFFLAWALVAARPWAPAAAADPRLKALAAREAQLRRESKLVNQVVAQRWALYRSELHARTLQIASAKAKAQTARLAALPVAAAAPSAAAAPASAPVRIVNLPPLTVTRTS